MSNTSFLNSLFGAYQFLYQDNAPPCKPTFSEPRTLIVLGKCPSFLFILDRSCWVSQKAWNHVAQAGLELEILTLAVWLYPASCLPAPHLLCLLLLFIMPYFLALWVPPATALGSTVQSATSTRSLSSFFWPVALETRLYVLCARSGCGCAPSALCSHSSVTIVHFNALTPLPQRHWRVADTWSQNARSKRFCLFLETSQYHLVPETARLLYVLLEGGHFPGTCCVGWRWRNRTLHLLVFNWTTRICDLFGN